MSAIMRDIGGHVLAHLPVAARGGAHQPAVLVAQRAGQAVDLVLGRHRHFGIIGQVEETPHPRDEIGHFLVGEGVVEAHHPHFVRDLGERRGGDCVPDLAAGLSARIRCGNAASSSALRRTSASYSASEISGESSAW
jgi:hypothetical protein